MTETADYRYLAKLLGINQSNANRLLKGRRVNKGGKGTQALYSIADMDKIAAEWLGRFEPLKDGEWLASDVADHFNVAVSTAQKLAHHKDFPEPTRMFTQGKGLRSSRVWLREDIESLKVSDFVVAKPRKKIKVKLKGLASDRLKFLRGDYAPRNFA